MIDLVPFSSLDSAAVEQAYAEILQRVSDDNARLDLRKPGVLAQLLLRYNAILSAQRQANIDQYWLGRSLQAMEENPELVSDELVDAALSNFRVTRSPGAIATGDVTVIVSDDVTVTIAEGSTWNANGVALVSPRVYTAKIDGSQLSDPGDRPLTRTADGRWAFTITLQATAAGVVNIVKDTTVVPTVVPPGYLTSYAASDFTGGLAPETNTQLLQTLQSGIAARTIGNRPNMQAMLRNDPRFVDVVATSIIGLGDPEMLRDQHTILPMSFGGRCDWYVRTAEKIVRTRSTRTATLVSKVAGTGTWQLSFDRTEAAGVYEVADVRPVGATAAGGFTITRVTRTLDKTGAGLIPDMTTVAEAAYGRFTAIVVQFVDDTQDALSLEIGAERDYEVELRGLPLIATLQDFVSDRNVSNYGADCLVKAPVPCLVQLALTIHKRTGDDDPDLAAIRDSLCTTVNRTGFVGRLFASRLQEAIYQHLTSDQRVSAIAMFGTILYPNGDVGYLQSAETLTIPNDPANLVTGRTTQFFLDPSAIGITVVTSVPADG